MSKPDFPTDDSPNQIFQAMFIGKTSVATTGGSSASLGAFSNGTSLIRVVVVADTWIAIGPAPTADKTTSVFMPAGTVEYFAVNGGDVLAHLQDSAAGTICVTEGA